MSSQHSVCPSAVVSLYVCCGKEPVVFCRKPMYILRTVSAYAHTVSAYGHTVTPYGHTASAYGEFSSKKMQIITASSCI